MTKVTLNSPSTLGNQAQFLGALETLVQAVENAFDNTVSRDGSSPNTMEAALDMNSHRILNVGEPVADADAVTKAYVDTIAFESGGTINLTVTSSLITAKNIGCVEDGVNDDGGVIMNYFNAHPEGGTLHFDGSKVYRFANRLDIPSGWSLKGNNCTLSMNKNSGIYFGGGPVPGKSANFYASSNKDLPYVDVATLDGSKFAVNDYVALQDSAPGDMNFELNQISSKDSSNPSYTRIYLKWLLSRNFTTGNSSTIFVISPNLNSSIQGFNIFYNEEAAPGLVHPVEFFYAVNGTVRDVYILNSGPFGYRGNGIREYKSLGTTVENCYVADPKYFAAGEGYGFSCYYSVQSKWNNNYARGCRHGFLWQGSTNSLCNNAQAIGCRISSFEAHGHNEIGLTLSNYKAVNTHLVTGDSAGHTAVKLLGGQNIFVANGVIVGFNRNTADTALYIEPPASNIQVTSLTIDRCYTGVTFRENPGSPATTAVDVVLSNMKISNCTSAFDLSCDGSGATTPIFDQVFITGCVLNNNVENVLAKACTIRFQGNYIHGSDESGKWAVVVDTGPKSVVLGNVIEDTARGVYVLDSPDTSVLFNTFIDLSDGVIGQDATGNARLIIRNNAIVRTTSPTIYGIGNSTNTDIEI